MNSAQRYLEVGVNEGRTFLEVDIPYKDAVDPNFLFDTRGHHSDRVRFFPETSDRFWTSGSATTYDVIFLDGLHTFEQTLRDLISSMTFSHGRTVWLIDDTIPSDVFSAIPDQQRSYRERQRMKLSDNPWHGDIYKVVFALHDFFPTMSYATIVGSGNPQTLVWYAPRTDFKPRANNLEAISRATFFDIAPNRRVFNLMSETDALKTLSGALNGLIDTHIPMS